MSLAQQSRLFLTFFMAINIFSLPTVAFAEIPVFFRAKYTIMDNHLLLHIDIF